MTPSHITVEQAWSKIKPNVCHLDIFGSEAWDNIFMKRGKS